MAEALPLIQTKLYRPPIEAAIVPRPRLLDQLNKHWQERPLTLISAPAGYGKSVLASMWLQEFDYPNAWVSLDETDNNLRTFAAYLLAAIRQAFPDLPLQSEALLKVPSLPSVSVLARYLLNDLALVKSPFILALDDIHVIHEKAIFDFLAELLRHPPQAMHLVVIGRQDPPLPVASLRVYRRLTEIRTRELRFITSETVDFLKRVLKRDVDARIAAEWTEWTEGWATALHLAALSLSQRPETSDLGAPVRGDSRYLGEYLMAEILARLAPEKQLWLLKTSLLDRFCAPLCEVVCREEGEGSSESGLTGQAFIQWLRQANLFLISLDDRNEWFRFHHLFQESLQAQLLERLSEEEVTAMHRRASAWYGENGWIEEAIQHALAAGDTTAAVALVAGHRFQLMNDERWNRLESWIEIFPDAIVRIEPILLMTVVYLPKTRDRDMEYFDTWNRAIELVAAMPADSPMATQLRGEVASLRAVLAAVVGPASGAIDDGSEAVSLLPPEAQYNRAQAIAARAMGYQMSGDYDRGASIIREARSDSGWMAAVRARLPLYLAFASFFEGVLGVVRRSARESIRLAESHLLWDTITQGRYLLGVAHYLGNELKMAESQLTALVEKPELATPEYLAQATCALARVHMVQGNPEKAHQVLRRVISYLEDSGSEFSQEIPRAFQVELALDQGDITLARRLSGAVDFDMNRPVWFHYTLQLTPVKLLLAEGATEDLKKALTSLEKLGEYVAKLNRIPIWIDVLALQALVYDAQGDRQMATERLKAALRLGQRGEFIRNFADLGVPMADMLARLSERNEKQMEALRPYMAQILAAFPRERRSTATAAAEARLDLNVSLTAREAQTLRLLAGELSPQEMASELTISLATVRTHIKNVYAKLDVHSRFEAVQQAKELGLI